MRKKLTLLLLFIASSLLFFCAPAASAQTFPSGIEDSAQLLGNNLAPLSQDAQKLAQQTKAGIFVVTTNSSTPADQFARDYLAQKVGQGKNGTVLVINMNLRKVYIWATGNMEHYLPSPRINATLDVVQPALTDGDAVGAVNGFLEKVQTYYESGLPTSRKYSIDPQTGAITCQRSFRPGYIAIAALIAALSGGIFVWTIYRRYQMKDAHAIWRYDYSRNGDLDLTDQQDLLVNTFITTRRIPRPSSNGGGGGSGGSGGGRSF